MSEKTDNETLEILKLLVEKIQKLEQTVYDNDNILMKSGFVKVDSPSPRLQAGDGIIPDSDTIAKMSWDEINNLVTKLGGASI
jgi:hypothetical protein